MARCAWEPSWAYHPGYCPTEELPEARDGLLADCTSNSDVEKLATGPDQGRDRHGLCGAGLGLWCAEAQAQHQLLFTQPAGKADSSLSGSPARSHKPCCAPVSVAHPVLSSAREMGGCCSAESGLPGCAEGPGGGKGTEAHGLEVPLCPVIPPCCILFPEACPPDKASRRLRMENKIRSSSGLFVPLAAFSAHGERAAEGPAGARRLPAASPRCRNSPMGRRRRACQLSSYF